MKNIISNFYHKYIKYKFLEFDNSIDYKLICDFDKVSSEKYRLKLFDEINLNKVTNTLDYGCGYGQNMSVLKNLKNDIDLNCVDISQDRIKMLNVINENIYKFKLNQFKIDELKKFDNKFDLVFTDAVLIYINTNNIKKILKNLIKSSRKFLLFHELTYAYSYQKINHLYIHDYKRIIKQINSRLKIKIIKSLKLGTPWSTHGTKIIIEK